MLSILILITSVLTTFLLPLFLTFKAVKQDGPSSSRPSTANSQLQFLACYWVSYTLVLYIENLFEHQLLLSTLNQNYITSLSFLLFRIWLFYYHGCLVLTKTYGELIGSFIAAPFIRRHVRDNSNSPASHFQELRAARHNWLYLFEVNTDQYFKQLFDSIVTLLKFSGGSKFPVGNSLVLFHEYLRVNGNVTYLHGCLCYICFMDSPQEISLKYRMFLGLINSVSQQVRPPQRASSLKSGNGSRRPSNRTPSPLPVKKVTMMSGTSPENGAQAAAYMEYKNSRHSSRSNSNNMTREVFSPSRFNIMDEDAISLNSSPSPSPSPTPPLEAEVQKLASLLTSISQEQQHRIGTGLQKLSLPLGTKTPFRIINATKTMFEQRQPNLNHLDTYTNAVRSVSYELLRNEMLSNDLRKSEHFIDPRFAAKITSPQSLPDELIVPLSRPRLLSQPQPPYPLDDADTTFKLLKRKSVKIPAPPPNK